MSQLLATLAVIKVNWDLKRDDVAANLMPLVGYAIKTLPSDVVSSEDVRRRMREVAEFDLPTGAVSYLIRRAAKPKYAYLQADGGVYRRRPENLLTLDFEKRRAAVTTRLNGLFEAFNAFNQLQFGAGVDEGQASVGFFDVLYSLAPNLMHSAFKADSTEPWDEGADGSLRYRISKFIKSVIAEGGENLNLLKDFSIGAALTESFYYTNPESVTHKLRNVAVYFDTSVLLHVLGICEDAQHQAAIELVDILRSMRAKLRYFEKTRNELHGILWAAAKARAEGRLLVFRPGDVFDCYSRAGATASDIEHDLATFDKRLEVLGISHDYGPEFEDELGIDQAKLETNIRKEITTIQDKALDHDTYVLAAMFRLRHGKYQRDFESCEAIFVTSNNSLCLASQKFFSEEYGPSNAPICISDSVFTMLMWLKAVEKRPNLPVDRLVANCIAAMNPSARLWERYSEAIEKAYQNKSIDETECALLLSTLEAKEELMDTVVGKEEVFVEGTVLDVLRAAKARLAGEAGERAAATEKALALERARSVEVGAKVEKLMSFAVNLVKFVTNLIVLATLLGAAIFLGDDILTTIQSRGNLSLSEWLLNAPLLVVVSVLFVSGFVGSSPLGVSRSIANFVGLHTRRALERLVDAQ